MNTITTPALARTDATQASGGIQPATTEDRLLTASGARVAGFAITALALTHVALFGGFVGDWDSPTARMLVEIAGYALQLAIIGVLLVMWRTRAVGDGNGWRLTGATVTALAVAAIASGVVHQLLPDSAVALNVTNALMLCTLAGFYVLAIGVVSERRWRGFLRFVPMLASSWGPVVVFVIVLGGEEASWWAFILYLSAGVLVSGLTLAARPDLAVTPAAVQQ
jgi:hypothetical protein